MSQLQDFENDCRNWLDNLLSSEIQKAEAAKEIKYTSIKFPVYVMKSEHH